MVSIHRPLGYGPSTLPLRHSARQWTAGNHICSITSISFSKRTSSLMFFCVSWFLLSVSLPFSVIFSQGISRPREPFQSCLFSACQRVWEILFLQEQPFLKPSSAKFSVITLVADQGTTLLSEEKNHINLLRVNLCLEYMVVPVRKRRGESSISE